MKVFVIAMLAGGTLVLLAALFWPNRSPPVSQRQQHFQPITSNVDTRELPPAPERADLPTSPPQPATPATPATDISGLNTADAFPSPPPMANKPALESNPNRPGDSQLTPDEQQTLKETATDNTSLRNHDFPRTYISAIHVDLTSPNHSVRLTWSGPLARSQETGPFHSSPGRGYGANNCNDVTESNRANSNCTPKGIMHVQAFSNSMVTSPECRYVTWFNAARGVAFHYYPNVPDYPASHGCVRLEEMHAAQLIHNNSKIGETEVTVDGTWKFVQ